MPIETPLTQFDPPVIPGTATVPADGGWVDGVWASDTQAVSGTAKGMKRFAELRDLHTTAGRVYGPRPLGLVLPRPTSLPVTLRLAEYVEATDRRRQAVRNAARDLLAVNVPTSVRRSTNAVLRVVAMDAAKPGREVLNDARSLIASATALHNDIETRVRFSARHQHPELRTVPLTFAAISITLAGFQAPWSGGRWFVLAGAIALTALLVYGALYKGWQYGYNQAIWLCAEAGSYGLKEKRQVRAEVARIEGEARQAKARAEATFAKLIRTRRMAFKLPRKPHGEGYLYVVGFNTGTVKVGQSEDPKVRLPTHRREAEAFGVHIVNYWISPSHSNFLANETRLINRCVAVSHRSRKEYFHTVGYDQAKTFATELTFFSNNLTQTSIEGVWA